MKRKQLHKHHPALLARIKADNALKAAREDVKAAREDVYNLPVVATYPKMKGKLSEREYVRDGGRTCRGRDGANYTYWQTERPEFVPHPETVWPEQLGVVYRNYLGRLRAIPGLTFEAYLFSIVREGEFHLLPRKEKKAKKGKEKVPVARRKFAFDQPVVNS